MAANPDQAICCQNPDGLKGKASPLQRVICVGWYDGPLEGFAECSVCKRTYYFKKLDEAEDGAVSPYALTIARDDAFGKVTDAIRPLGEPRWPVEVPLWIWPSESQRLQAEEKIRAVTPRTDAPSWVLYGSGIDGLVLSARSLRPGDSLPTLKKMGKDPEATR